MRRRVFLAGLAGGAMAAGGWTSGCAPAPRPAPPPPRRAPLWTFRYPDGDGEAGDPLRAGDTLYARGSGGGAVSTLYALDPATGVPRWRFREAETIGHVVTVGRVLVVGPTRARPDGPWFGADPATGAVRWRADGITTDGGVAADTETVFVTGTDGSGARVVRALGARDGRVRWSVPVPGGTGPVTVAGTPAGALVVVGGTALGAADGRVAWRAGVAVRPSAGAVPAGDAVYTLGSDDSVLALATGTGRPLWTAVPASPPSFVSAPAGGLVYAGTAGGLEAFDAVTGARRWTAALKDAPRESSSVVVSGGVLVAATGRRASSGQDGKVSRPRGRLVALDTATGRELWSFGTGTDSGSTLAAAGGAVFAAHTRSYLSAFDAPTGAVRWALATPGPVTRRMVTADGTGYVTGEDVVHAVALG